MKAQSFKTPIGNVHEKVIARPLNMEVNSHNEKGIDLLDHRKGVEVKSCLIDPQSKDSRKRYSKWTLFDYQLSWGKRYDVELYCALGTYQLDLPVSRIWTRNPKRLEAHVTKREFWIVPWDWTTQFPIRHGKHHDYRYLVKEPKRGGLAPIPKTIHEISIPKGVLHFTEGVDPKMFV
ncbi:hypothetical protein CMI41_02510 [Candidatus Pacearchaeota archaeon]|nr:hypothetical protein [Candidatus Pacearchaeota archaeon]|tara:strand:+ start:5091 stop:5621 length:531 start_codon:yes stop_codon:yes gene_type:complete